MMRESVGALNILVMEDDARLRSLLSQGLRELGHTVMPACDGEAGLELAMRLNFDVLLIDIGLPLRDGYSVTQALRAHTSVPILMLTARDAEEDVIRGLNVGADHYLTKPFSFPELVARIHALSRSYRRNSSVSRLVLDHARLTICMHQKIIRLTRSEFLLLACLAENDSCPVPRKSLADAVWGLGNNVSANTLDVLVNALRAKIETPFETKCIQTVRGLGYRLHLDAAAQETPARLLTQAKIMGQIG